MIISVEFKITVSFFTKCFFSVGIRKPHYPQCFLNPQEIHINRTEYFWARCKHGKKYNKDV